MLAVGSDAVRSHGAAAPVPSPLPGASELRLPSLLAWTMWQLLKLKEFLVSLC